VKSCQFQPESPSRLKERVRVKSFAQTFPLQSFWLLRGTSLHGLLELAAPGVSKVQGHLTSSFVIKRQAIEVSGEVVFPTSAGSSCRNWRTVSGRSSLRSYAFTHSVIGSSLGAPGGEDRLRR